MSSLSIPRGGFLSIFKEKNQQPNSPFDCLPDDVILIIFNKIQDAKTLIASFSLNKRLATIIPETDVVSLSLIIPHSSYSYLSSLSYSLEKEDATLYGYNRDRDRNKNKNNRTIGNLVKIFKSAVNCLITKLLRSSGDYRRIENGGSGGDNSNGGSGGDNSNGDSGGDNSNGDGDSVSGSACQRLRMFRQISHLHIEIHSDLPDVIELPPWAISTSDDIFRWKASYGTELKTWTLICCFVTLRPFAAGEWWPESDLTGQSQLRKMQMALCLEAAYARHHLVKEMAAQLPTLKTVTVTDAKREGRLSMSENDIQDLRESEGAPMRLLLRMWYTPLLELPVAQCTWKDAMLIVIRPVDRHGREMVPAAEEENGGSDGGFDGDPEEKAMFAEAQREIVISSKTVRHAWWLRTTRIE